MESKGETGIQLFSNALLQPDTELSNKVASAFPARIDRTKWDIAIVINNCIWLLGEIIVSIMVIFNIFPLPLGQANTHYYNFFSFTSDAIDPSALFIDLSFVVLVLTGTLVLKHSYNGALKSEFDNPWNISFMPGLALLFRLGAKLAWSYDSAPSSFTFYMIQLFIFTYLYQRITWFRGQTSNGVKSLNIGLQMFEFFTQYLPINIIFIGSLFDASNSFMAMGYWLNNPDYSWSQDDVSSLLIGLITLCILIGAIAYNQQPLTGFIFAIYTLILSFEHVNVPATFFIIGFSGSAIILLCSLFLIINISLQKNWLETKVALEE
jgi:hypothetical protein